MEDLSLQLQALRGLGEARSPLIADCSTLRSTEVVTEQLWQQIDRDLQAFKHQVALQTRSYARVASGSTPAIQKKVASIYRAFADLHAACRCQASLNQGDAASIELIAQHRSIFHSICHFAAMGNARAQEDLRKLVCSGDPEAEEVFASFIIDEVDWAMDVELLDQQPSILKNLVHLESLHCIHVFRLFLSLAKEKQNSFALELLSHAVFSNPRQFSTHLDTLQNDPLIRNFRIVLYARIPPCSSGEVRVSPEDAVVIQRLTAWMQGLSPRRYGAQGPKELVHCEPVVQCKVLLAQLLREQTMEAILVRRAPPPRLTPVLSKDFPPTACWLVGLPEKNPFSNHSLYVLERLAAIGRQHGIEIIAGAGSLPASLGDAWIQDNQAWSIDRGLPVLRTPALTRHYSLAILQDRLKRNIPTIESGVLGESNRAQEQLAALFFAHVARIPCAIGPCFTEGGNSLTGIDERGQPYVIVGLDTVAWARAQVAQEMWTMGYVRHNEEWIQRPDNIKLPITPPSDDELKLLLAHYYGVDPAHIFFCEQPAEYHLDVAMTIIGPKTVMINDSVLAANLMLSTLRQLQNKPLPSSAVRQFLETAQKRKQTEDIATQQLADQGFTAHRFGGSTYNPFAATPEKHRINLFNFLSATTPSGEKLIISMGCPEAFQTEFRDFIASHIAEDVIIEFLDESWSQTTLSFSGGVKCMTQSLPVHLGAIIEGLRLT